MNTDHNRLKPQPIPLKGFELRARDIFSKRPLTAHLNRNAGWLQALPRSTEAIESTLFPDYKAYRMESEEVLQLLNRALWNMGYTPSSNSDTDNYTWHWLDGKTSA